MALPDTVKRVLGTVKVFSNSGEYVPTDAGQPTGTDADIDLGALATGGVAQQSVKLDLGSANLDVEWMMKAYIEFHSAPTAGRTVEFYLGWSNDATAGEDNPGNLSGTDAVYQGCGADTASGTGALNESFGANFQGGHYADMAMSLGAWARRVETPAQFVQALGEAVRATESGRPAVIECKVKAGYDWPGRNRFAH